MPPIMPLTVGIAINGETKSKYVVNWALGMFFSEERVEVKLLHVRPKITVVPAPMGNFMPISGVRDDVASAYIQEMKWQTNRMLLPYKNICTQRKVKVDVIIIESDDVANAIAEEVVKCSINKLIIGASSRGIFSWKLNLSSRISSCTPNFCTVYVISKGKLSSIRRSDLETNGSTRDDSSVTSSSANISSNCSSSSQTDVGSLGSYSQFHSPSLPVQRVQAYDFTRYYKFLRPVSKIYGVTCLMTTAAEYLGLYNYQMIALFYGDVIKRFQVWRLITNFFFLGLFSFPFAFRLIIIAKYGVSLERGPFDKRTGDFVWMFFFGALSLLVMAAVSMLWSPFMGVSLVFMIVYVWSCEFPNARINIYDVVSLKGFYLPWAMLALDLIFGNPLKPDILGMVAGHLYYFLAVLHPLSGGKNILKTPFWVHKLVAFWGEGTQVNAPLQRNPSAGVAFPGRSYRLSSTRTGPAEQAQATAPAQQSNNSAKGMAFRGRSYLLGGR